MTKKTAEKSKESPNVMASIQEEEEEDQAAKKAEDSLESRTPTRVNQRTRRMVEKKREGKLKDW